MKNAIKILKTKTFWINFVGLSLMVLNDQVLGKMVPTEYAASILALLNIANRFLTNQAVSEK